MPIEFRPENENPQASFQPEPAISFEEHVKIDGTKFGELIEPYAKDLADENKRLQRKVEKLMDGRDPHVSMVQSGLLGVGAITFFALALFSPITPLLALAFLGCGGAMAYGTAEEIKNVIIKPIKIGKIIAHNDNLQKILNSDEFKSLNVFESRKDFFKRIFKRVEQGQLTGNDLKAVLFLHQKIKKDNQPNPDTDKLIDDLQREWDFNKRIVDWNQKIKAD